MRKTGSPRACRKFGRRVLDESSGVSRSPKRRGRRAKCSTIATMAARKSSWVYFRTWETDVTSPIYEILSAWPGRTESPMNIGDKFLRTIDILDGLSENLSNWTILDKPSNEYLPLTDMLSGSIARFVETQVNRDDYGDPDSDDGYFVLAVCDVAQKMDRQQHGCFYVHAGSKFRNYSLFEIGSHVAPPDPSLITFPIFKAALLTMISIWPAPWANAQCGIWGQRAPTLPGEP